MAKANAEGGATHYVAEGAPVPADLSPGVRLVGPGAPRPGPLPGDPVPPASAAPVPGDEDEPPDYAAYRLTDLRDLCRERGLQVTGGNGYAPKAELAARLAAHDAGHRALL